MDTIIWIINQHNVYINDYYKGAWKTLNFHKKDFYEAYCHYDISELIDYMNYPLNYKNFQGSNLIIIYDMPIIYDYFYKVQERFTQANSLILKDCLKELVLWTAYNKKILTQSPSQVMLEGVLFEITLQNQVLEINEIEEDITSEEEDYLLISMVDCAKMVLLNNAIEVLENAPFPA